MPKKKGALKIVISIILVLVIVITTLILVKTFVIDKKEENIIDTPPVEHNLNELKFDKYTKVENGVLTNKSDKIKEEKVIDEFTITDYELTYDHGTHLVGNVKNNSSQDKNERTKVTIKFLDESGAEIGYMIGSIPPVYAGDTVQINTSTTSEIINVYDVKVEKMQ